MRINGWSVIGPCLVLALAVVFILGSVNQIEAVPSNGSVTYLALPVDHCNDEPTYVSYAWRCRGFSPRCLLVPGPPEFRTQWDWVMLETYTCHDQHGNVFYVTIERPTGIYDCREPCGRGGGRRGRITPP